MECGGFEREKENEIKRKNCDSLSHNFGSSFDLACTQGVDLGLLLQIEHSSCKSKFGTTCAFLIFY